jgi:hypothetical protein
MRSLSFEIKNEGYFEDLALGTKNLIRDAMLNAYYDISKPDCYPYLVKDIECHSRDGFIPFSHNKGGLQVKGFSDLMGISGSGYYPNAKASHAKIESEIEAEYKRVAEAYFERHKELLESLGLTIDDCNYHKLEELGKTIPELKNAANEIQDFEYECLSGEYSSVMYELQFMYHGKDSKGVHSASVAAALNTEAPYHRSGRCELAKELEISWKNQVELKRELAKALIKVTKAIF